MAAQHSYERSNNMTDEGTHSLAEAARKYVAQYDEASFQQLHRLAEEHGWQAKKRTIDSWALLNEGRPRSTKPGNDHPWFRVIVVSEDLQRTTMDVQPIFRRHLRPASNDDVIFVRAFNPLDTWTPGLHVVSYDEQSQAIIRQFELPEGLSTECNRTGPVIQSELPTSHQRQMRSTLDFLNQHRAAPVLSATVAVECEEYTD